MTDAEQPQTNASGKKKRLSRWDRPPEPHDWRWVVGNIGRALITIGLLMFAFVGYQLWGTGIQEARAQDQLGRQFDQAIADAGLNTTTPPTDSTTDTGSTVPTSAEPGASTTSTMPPEPQEQVFPPDIAPGDAIAAIAIPSIGVNKYVVAGVSVKDLRKGVGHFPNTPFPGQLGNSAIAGHRTTYGQPFYRLDKVHIGDEIKISTILGGRFVYIVSGTEEVGKNDYHVITDSNPKKATLTLITCTPIGTASRRLVVHADLDPTQSSQVGKTTLFYGQTPSTAVTPTLPDDPQTGATTEDGNTSADSVVPDSNLPNLVDPASTAPGGTAAVGVAPDEAAGFGGSSDAFNQGWFGDGRAWPHVIGWGLLLIAVCVVSYQIAKRFRRLWLGFVVGFVPFLVVLYFFFENVNRMLPATI